MITMKERANLRLSLLLNVNYSTFRLRYLSKFITTQPTHLDKYASLQQTVSDNFVNLK